MMGDLRDTVALVTGGARGIGHATAVALREAGATVIAADLAFGASAGPDEIHLDVTREESWNTVVSTIENRHGHLDILVNNAGVDIIEKFEDITLSSWRTTQSINIDAVFIGMQKCLPLLKTGGTRRAGGASIVNMSSIAGFVGADFNAAYCASKGAVRLLTKAVALEFSALGYPIRVNSVHPGGVDTPLVDSIFQRYVDLGVAASAESAYDLSRRAHPLGRMAKPAEIAAGIRFLASDEASFMHGAELLLDGGYTAR